MNEMVNLQYETKTLDVTEKGIVTVAVNGIGVEDVQHDISQPGSFVDTLRDDITKMRWLLNHNISQLLGVPLSGEEKDNNLIMTGQLNLKKQIGRDILEDYKLFRDNGRTLEHSIGVTAVKRDNADRRKVLQWKMLEYSTLTGWGANPQTFLVGIKSATPEQITGAVDLLRNALKQHGYSDERLKTYDMQLNLLLKTLKGAAVVACPCCGHQFDYDNEPEHTFTQEVQDAAADLVGAIARGEARRQVERYSPEIRQQVAAIIDGIAGTKKSITDVFAYVRCPHCWSRVYRSHALAQEPEQKEGDKDDVTEKSAPEPAPAPAPSFWPMLAASKN